MNATHKFRYGYFAGLLVVLSTGLLLRKYADVFPEWVKLYAGDFLWAVAAYLFFSAIFSNTHIVAKIVLALAFCYLIEASQLYHAPWLEQLRSYTLVKLVIGAGFLWSDIVAYSLGVFCIAIPDLMLYASRRIAN